jgi:excisionase family DNA binding protein
MRARHMVLLLSGLDSISLIAKSANHFEWLDRTQEELAWHTELGGIMASLSAPRRQENCYQLFAAGLHIHRSKVVRLASRGDLPGFKVGLKWRFHRREIDEWRLARTVRKPT